MSLKNKELSLVHLIKDERGLSLVSVMVAAGIMGFLAMVMMKMQDNQLKVQNDMIARTEITNFMGKLNNYMSRTDYCEKTFSGKRINPNTLVKIDKIINPIGRVIYKTGEKYGNNAFTLVSMEQHDFIWDNEEQTSGILTLRVSMEKNKNAVGAKTIVKDIELDLQLDDQQKVTGCGSLAAAGVGGGQNLKEPPIDVKVFAKALEGASQKVDPKAIQEVQKAMENNPALQMLKKSLEHVEATNKKFGEEEERNLKEAEEFD